MTQEELDFYSDYFLVKFGLCLTYSEIPHVVQLLKDLLNDEELCRKIKGETE